MNHCKHYAICRLDEEEPGSGLCILHSEDRAKNKLTFRSVLRKYSELSKNFSYIVFPEYADFSNKDFKEEVMFNFCKFLDGVDFNSTTFSSRLNVSGTDFSSEVSFFNAKFRSICYFFQTNFHKKASFSEATFNKEPYFQHVSFANVVDFSNAKFCKKPIFYEFKFNERPIFSETEFIQGANFHAAEFKNGVSFSQATFSEEADFRGVLFKADTDFVRTTFKKGADFKVATFFGEANFNGAKFLGGANFQETGFKGREVDFNRSSFLGRALFTGRREEKGTVPIFSGADVNFAEAVIDPPDALTFIKADLRKCRFQNTNLQKVQLTDIGWPQFGDRLGVYDETFLKEGTDKPWGQIEQLYRQLKKNYEDGRDYERAGHFHYGEKEMRRNNPATSRGYWFLLTLYWLFSGYGERWIRPLIWTGVLLTASTFGYLCLGLFPAGVKKALSWTNFFDWLTVSLYSLQVILLLKPDDLILTGLAAKAIHTLQSLFGPILIALLALAVRQKLKR